MGRLRSWEHPIFMIFSHILLICPNQHEEKGLHIWEKELYDKKEKAIAILHRNINNLKTSII